VTINFKPSPNFDTNRKPIDRIVIHWFGIGTLASANKRFLDPNSGVSAHYGISDKTVYQWVLDKNVAYHAGNYEMNQRSIGIEHDAGIDPAHDLSEASYNTSGELIRIVCERHSIPLDREHIIAHKEVKATQCPGTVDINRLISIAKGGDLVFTSKTKVPIGGVWGEPELQALRSILNDQKRSIDSLSKDSDKLKGDVLKLTEEVNKLKSSVKEGFSNPIANLFYQVALAFEK